MATIDQTPTHTLQTPPLSTMDYLTDPEENMAFVKASLGVVRDRLLKGITVDAEAADDMSRIIGAAIDRLPVVKKNRKTTTL